MYMLSTLNLLSQQSEAGAVTIAVAVDVGVGFYGKRVAEANVHFLTLAFPRPNNTSALREKSILLLLVLYFFLNK